MKIKKLTQQSKLKLYKAIKNPDLQTVKRYTTKGRQWVNNGVDLELYPEGSYEIDDKYIDNDGQYKFDASTCQKDDFKHAKIIYTQLSDLTAADANDSRLWTRLTHDHFHNYVRERWYTKKIANNTNTKTINQILDRSHFFGNGQRARVNNAVSRLWWVAHLTVRLDEANEETKWELTKAAFKYQENTSSLLQRNMGAYDNIRFGFLEFFVENETNLKSEDVQKMGTALNNYGGGNILPLLTKTEVKEILLKIKQDL